MIIKKYWLVTILLGVLLLGFLIKPNNKTTMENNNLLTPKHKKQFAIYVEQTKGAKDWQEVTEFPGKGYKLGSLTKCVDNTGAVVSDTAVMNSDGSVTVTSNSTAYCTLYFEISSSLFADTIKDKYESDETPLGDPAQGNDGYLIYHDGKGNYTNAQYEAGDYSYRFAGNNPDNYVCMDGKNKEGTCDPKKLYRIIGLFPENPSNPATSSYQIKLIKSEYLTYEETEDNLKVDTSALRISPSGWTPRVENQANVNGFYWNGLSSIRWNNWKSSELNAGLNKEDGVYLQSLQPYIDAELISDTTWYIGGNDGSKIYQQANMKLAYDNELGIGKLTPETGTEKCTQDSTTNVDCTNELLYQTSKVGLMYATEYGYASEPASWTTQLYDYNDRSNSNKNKENNWLYNGVQEWLLTRVADETMYAFYIVNGGNVLRNFHVSLYANGVRPVIVLSSYAEFLNGAGSKSSPWRIKLPEYLPTES